MITIHNLLRRFRVWMKATLALLLLSTLTVAHGCANSGPRLSGFAIGDTRVVNVGDIVEFRNPINEQGARDWRVTSYDSLYLSLIESPRVVQTDDGGLELLARARAAVPGETEIIVSEITPGVQSPRTIRFRVRILE